ncbi:MAG: CapA family protein [Chloroflexi bacterium]|nr:CapA family protein [Chloroflexota bacterium]
MTLDKGSKDAIVIHAVGNVGPRRVEYGEPVESLFRMAHEKIKESDISFCHLEWVFSSRGCMQYRDHNTWRSRAEPGNVKALAFAGFNVVSHAGNRCFDFGPDALVDSVEIIRSNGMQAVGAGRDIAEARAPVIVERKGIKVGFLAYNSVLPVEYEAREGKPGCAPLRVATYFEAQGYQPGTPPKVITVPREDDMRAMEEDIQKLRKRVDVVAVSIHWGQSSMPGVLAAYQPIVGRRAIDVGADLILGHHAGVIKGVEIYRGKAIFYCLGNFGLEAPHHLKPPPGVYAKTTAPTYGKLKAGPQTGWERNPGPIDRRYAMMVKCIAGKTGILKTAFRPCYTNQRVEPEVLSRNDPRFEEILKYIEPWCRELGTGLSVEGDEVVVY